MAGRDANAGGGARERDAREGRLEHAEDGRWRLVFERRLAHAPEKVWRALTEEAHLAAWFPTTIEGERRAGAPLTFRFRGEEFPPSHGEMVAYDPPRVLEFTWGEDPEGAAGEERTRLEVRPDGAGSILTLTTTYDEVGKSARDAAGWHVCLDRLEAELAGRGGPVEGDPWTPMNERYKARFGPEASTIGPPEG